MDSSRSRTFISCFSVIQTGPEIPKKRDSGFCTSKTKITSFKAKWFRWCKTDTSGTYASSASECIEGAFNQFTLGTGTPMFLKRKSFISNDKLVSTLQRDSGLRRRFESFAEHQYASEGVSFMKDVLEWKSDTPGNVQEALAICEMYISEDAPLQVNISYATRTTLENQLEQASNQASVSLDLFNEAASEVSHMMVEGGVWGSFVWKGGCDNAEIDDTAERKQTNGN